MARAVVNRQPRSDGEQTSNHGSPMSTPSPGQRTVSMSPTTEMGSLSSVPHQYLGTSSLPAHLRTDLHASAPASTAAGGYNNIRPTSHPTSYAPPSTLEPNIEPQQGPPSAGGSPHMSSVGWQSPSHVASPSHTGSAYMYPDPDNYQSQLFYQGAPPARRPGSAEPGSAAYEVKQPRQSELWAGAQ